MIGPLLAALQFAQHKHRGQIDKGGHPYIEHVIRVMANTAQVSKECGQPEGMALLAVMVAAMHDTVEDTSATLLDVHDVANIMLPENAAMAVTRAVDAITHREGESYDAYLTRVEADQFARMAKIGDLLDNMSPDRILPDAAWQTRAMLRYRAAFDRLTGGETTMAQLLNAIQPKGD